MKRRVIHTTPTIEAARTRLQPQARATLTAERLAKYLHWRRGEVNPFNGLRQIIDCSVDGVESEHLALWHRK